MVLQLLEAQMLPTTAPFYVGLAAGVAMFARNYVEYSGTSHFLQDYMGSLCLLLGLHVVAICNMDTAFQSLGNQYHKLCFSFIALFSTCSVFELDITLN